MSTLADDSVTVPITDLEVLGQEIDDDEARYRIRAGRRVHYVVMSLLPNPIFDFDTICRPYLLIPKLPPFPDSDWTIMHIHKTPNGKIEHVVSSEPLLGLESLWHPRRIDVMSLTRIARHKPRVTEVEFEDHRALSKIAIFEWWIPQLEREVKFYESISRDSSPGEPSIIPTFLGHLMEQERCVGLLMEKVEGRHPTLDDFAACEAVLQKLHRAGWVHGDVNRYNFLVEKDTGHVKMIDFEHAEPYDEEKAQIELGELKAELSEKIGRGATVIVRDGVEEVAGPYYYRTRTQGC